MVHTDASGPQKLVPIPHDGQWKLGIETLLQNAQLYMVLMLAPPLRCIMWLNDRNLNLSPCITP